MTKICEKEHYIDSVYYQLELTAKYCRYLGIQIFQKLGLSVTVDEFAAMDTILMHDGICQRDLAKLILKDRANTGRILNTLEEKGYVERYADTKNNRLVKKMTLTSKGKKVTEEISLTIKEYLERLPRIFTEEGKDNFIESIKKFRERLEQEVEMNI